MHHSKALLSNMHSFSNCQDAIEEIQMDVSNYPKSQHKEFYAGGHCSLLATAQKKIDLLLAKGDTFVPDDEMEEDCTQPERQESLVGFARVSSQAQDLDDQLYKLKQARCTKVFSGKHSGKADTNKEALEQLEDYVREGDIVVVTKLDRLGRSTSQVVSLIERLHNKGVFVRTLEQSIDTSKDDAMSKAFYQMMMVFAEMERSMIQSRLDEGKVAAVRSGKHTEQSVKGGRSASYTPKQKQDVLNRLNNKQSINSIAKDTGLTRQTIYRIKGKPQ
ncbi:recombinase family protein [Vibrio sp. 1863]|uniref:recombinase family protein n=1 Tax=Vibrio sp. 1863 TaxID=3074579 RepID=UPI0029646DBD|nr:recombinase family protein [Vibrio sp. 1863]MDW2077397.1 recombinase family protein [Vibrio sp. 1863]